MQLDLKKIPFTGRLSRHMLYEETDNHGAGWAKGLYLALAADGGSSFIGGPMAGPKGFALVTPVSGGKHLAYTYTASPASVDLKTDKGAVRVVLDGDKVLRVAGSGVGLRLDGRLGFGSTAIMTARGVEITMAGGIYLIAARKGSLALDCHWELKALRSTDPIITVEPDESGDFELAIYDTDEAYELPPLSESLDDCAEASEADYKAFVRSFAKETGTDDEYREFFDACVYALWAGFQSFKGKELVPANKMADLNVYSMEQAVTALAIPDAGWAVDMLLDTLSFATPQGMVPAWFAQRQNLNEAVPPVYAYTVSRLIDAGGLDDVSTEKLAALYEAMFKTVNWWLTKRTGDKPLVYYAYRHECGWPREKIFGAGTPSVSPDLTAYMVLAADALSKIASKLGKDGPAASWGQISREQLDILTATLWDGEGFSCLNPLTGQKARAEGMLSLIPLLLGRRLPEHMIDVLARQAARTAWADIPVIPATLIILGLAASGRTDEARAAAKALIGSCAGSGTGDMRGKTAAPAGAFFSPAPCAGLLTLGGLI
jgi:hypothetical protein